MNVFRISAVLCGMAAALFTFTATRSHAAQKTELAFVASKTNGIARFRLERESGALTSDGIAAIAANPQFFALHPKRPFLYAINSATVDKKKTSVITAF